MGANITSGKMYKNNKSQTRPSIVIFGKKYFEARLSRFYLPSRLGVQNVCLRALKRIY